MKNKKGFTLVELLAVIVVLAIILVIAVPQITDIIKSSKLNSLGSTAKLIASKIEERQVELEASDGYEKIECEDLVNLDSNYKKCRVHMVDGKGTVTLVGAGKFEGMRCTATKGNAECREDKIAVNECTFNGELVDNAEYTNGQYKYTYSTSLDGWSMMLIDKDSTDPITTKMCTTINDKPIVSMNSLFSSSKTTSIDLSSFDTSNVTQMFCMFCNINVPYLDLTYFDLTNLTGTGGMFQNVTTNTIDLSGVNFGSASGLGGMFNNTNASLIDLSNAKFDSVTSLGGAFSGSNVDTLDLSNVSFDSVTSVVGMFSNVTMDLIDLSNVNFSNTTSLIGMFNGDIGTIDFSNIKLGNINSTNSMFSNTTVNMVDFSQSDLSVITDASDIFKNANIKTCLVKTIEDANKLNLSTNKPSTFTCEPKIKPEYVYAYGNITDASQGVKDYKLLNKDVFIRFNKNDLTEKYICVMYKSEERNGEPMCLLQGDAAINGANDPNGQWAQIKKLFENSGGSCSAQAGRWWCEDFSINPVYMCDTNASAAMSRCNIWDRNTNTTLSSCTMYYDASVECS